MKKKWWIFEWGIENRCRVTNNECELETLSFRSLTSDWPGQVGWKCKNCGSKFLETDFYKQQEGIAKIIIKADKPLQRLDGKETTPEEAQNWLKELCIT